MGKALPLALLVLSALLYVVIWKQLPEKWTGASGIYKTIASKSLIWRPWMISDDISTFDSNSQIPLKKTPDGPTTPTEIFTEGHRHNTIIELVTKLVTMAVNGEKSHNASDITPIPVLHKKDFEKKPEWDFDDVYLKDSSNLRQSSCSQSLRNTKDREFQKVFIPNIQLFLHKGSLNVTEWNRLAHFNNPFGFMEYNYTEMKAVVDLIVRPKSYQLLPVPAGVKDGCIRCAVVGTGGILNGSRKGREIDSHHYVFRMNAALTEGHEEDVGSKTSVYVHTSFSVTQSIGRLRQFGFKKIPQDKDIKYVLIPEGLRDYQWLRGLFLRKVLGAEEAYKGSKPWEYYPDQFDENSFYVLHPDFMRYIRNRFLPSKTLAGKHWAIYRPTNGAFALFLALHSCDVVDAYGFITEDHSKYPNYYYDSSKTHVVFYLNHDYRKEIKTWKDFHDAGIMRLYQRKEQGA